MSFRSYKKNVSGLAIKSTLRDLMSLHLFGEKSEHGTTRRDHLNKYRNKKITTPDGLVWDSKKELNRWGQLILKEQSGEIIDLQRQVRFELIPSQRSNGKVVERACRYIADFVYIDAQTGEKIVEDVKGYRKGTAYEVFKIKRKLMLYMHGIKVNEI